MRNGCQFIKSVSGDQLVYPGHPIVLATVMMQMYPTPEAAFNSGESSSTPAVLGDVHLPGEGKAILAALECLMVGHAGAGVDRVIAMGDSLWRVMTEHLPREFDLGVDQAKKFEPLFRSQVSNWLQIDTDSVVKGS